MIMNKSDYVRILELENKNYKNREFIGRLKRKIKYLEERCVYLYDESEYWHEQYQALKEKALRNDSPDFLKANNDKIPF